MQNKIIICSNIAGAGKDTAADYLVHQYGFKKLAFADFIYEIAKELFGMKDKDRKLLQDIGQKMREIDKDVWVNYTYKNATRMLIQGEKVVISDARQVNEYERAVMEGFLPIRILCDRDTAIQRIIKRDGKCDVSLLDNESEIGVRDMDAIGIDNNSSLEELYDKLDYIVNKDWTVYIEDNRRILNLEKFFQMR